MAFTINMPKQGQSVETCIFTDWLKKKGDTVKKGEPLFAYETDKASFEYESEFEGVLLETFYNAGDEVAVLVPVAIIGAPGEKVDAPKQAATATEAPAAITPTVSANPQTSQAQVQNNSGAKASPLARAMAAKMGVNISSIKGTGPDGRIIKRDILAMSGNVQVNEKNETKCVQPAASTVQTIAINAPAAITPVYNYDSSLQAGHDFDDKKISNVRKIIAQSMHASLQNSAQLTHHLSADVRKLLAYREQVKASMAKGSADNITLNDMVCLCVIRALKKMPEVNSHFIGDNIRTFKKVHLGLAVDTPRGLMVPCLKDADDFSLSGLSHRLKAVAESCKKGSIAPELLASTAASFTVSNLGNYGVEMFTPVINLPQVAILGVCTITYRPADIGGGTIAIIPVIGLSLTYDHRALDGGPATLFLKQIKTEIENFGA